MEKKQQHFVPEAYLKGWRDPETPEGNFVWIVSKKSQSVIMKSPKNLCVEFEFYTKFEDNGTRNIEGEDMLQKIEARFTDLQRSKIENHKPLNDNDRVIISEFLASMFTRVKSQREHQSKIWKETLDGIDAVAPQLKGSYAYKLMSELKKQPLPFGITSFIEMAIPHFTNMNCAIVENEGEEGFITSDQPCCVLNSDPGLPKSWRKTWKEIFKSPTLTVIFPISPRQLLQLTVSGHKGYLSVNNSKGGVDIMNKILTRNANEFIVSNTQKYRDEWFEGISS